MFAGESAAWEATGKERKIVKTTVLAAAAVAAALISPPPAMALSQTGIASYYGSKFQGRRTASGERFNNGAMTAAHRSAPFGSHLKVTNVANGRSVVVRVNDRGPFVRGRIVDLSQSAARHIGMKGRGLTRVRLARL
jgi:rare lipoprotein A